MLASYNKWPPAAMQKKRTKATVMQCKLLWKRSGMEQRTESQSVLRCQPRINAPPQAVGHGTESLITSISLSLSLSLYIYIYIYIYITYAYT